MKNFFKKAIEEQFKGCTPLQVIKQIVGSISIIFAIIVIAGADSIGAMKTAIYLSIVGVIWYIFDINNAFPDDKE